MFRRFVVSIVALVSIVAVVRAQAPTMDGSADWSAEAVPVAGEDALYEVVFTVRVSPGWHIFDLGPYEKIPSLATGFDFTASSGLELVGEPYQLDEPERKFDPIFKFETAYFEGVARFAQKVRIAGSGAGLGAKPVSGAGSGVGAEAASVAKAGAKAGATLDGEIEYQICRDGVGCIRRVWEFSVPIGEATSAIPASPVIAPTVAVSPATAASASSPARAAEGNVSGIGGVSDTTGGSGSLWSMILAAMGWALLALVTPCVFPMIPMTVSFFLNKSPDDAGSKTATAARSKFRAIMFGVFIVLIYTLPIAVLILVARFAGGEAVTADIFNWLATHWIPNVIFFAVFMIFAASLLGAFEIRLPSKLLNRSDKNADRAGMIGVFFLALTLVLVSFSCTVPIVGSAVIRSVQGEFWKPIATMLVFSVVFALPFTFFAFFPRIMERLPKSGSWLNSVKVILGLVEIALGLKFLSVADQTYHWGILDREVYLAIWIVVFSLLGFYLLGKLRFKYDSEATHIGVGRLAMAIAVFSFVVYLIPGMWGAPLKAISGYLPPMSTQEFIAGGGAPTGTVVNTVSAEKTSPAALSGERVKWADILSLPHGLGGYFDLEQALTHAREVGKPVFLDFTGHGCVNCREMEARVWSDPEVLGILREEYVVVAMYADDRTRLPEEEWLTTSSGKVLKTLGRKNSYIMNTRYGASAQPTYLLLNGEGDIIQPPLGYTLDIPLFVGFLRGGLKTYEYQTAVR